MALTLTGQKLADQAAELAQDTGSKTWTPDQLLEWINEAQLTLAAERPDASTTTTAVELVPGSKQIITARRLIDIRRNMGADGSTVGRSVLLVDRGALDEFDPDWQSATATAIVNEYMYDGLRDPKVFYVNPPVVSSPKVYVELVQAVDPPALAALAEKLKVDDIYFPNLLEWVMYRLFSRDAEETPNWARAARHYQSFYAMLGKKIKMDVFVDPRLRQHLGEENDGVAA